MAISDSVYLVVHTAVGWFFTLGSALLLYPAVKFLYSRTSPMPLDAVWALFRRFRRCSQFGLGACARRHERRRGYGETASMAYLRGLHAALALSDSVFSR